MDNTIPSNILDKAIGALSESARKAGIGQQNAQIYANEILPHFLNNGKDHISSATPAPIFKHLKNGLPKHLTTNMSMMSENNYKDACQTTQQKLSELTINTDDLKQSPYFTQLSSMPNNELDPVCIGETIWFKVPIQSSSIIPMTVQQSSQNDTIPVNVPMEYFVKGKVQFYGPISHTSSTCQVGVVLVQPFESVVLLTSTEHSSAPKCYAICDKSYVDALFNKVLALGCDGTYRSSRIGRQNTKTPPLVSSTLKSGLNANQISTENGKFFACELGHGFYLKPNECLKATFEWDNLTPLSSDILFSNDSNDVSNPNTLPYAVGDRVGVLSRDPVLALRRTVNPPQPQTQSNDMFSNGLSPSIDSADRFGGSQSSLYSMSSVFSSYSTTCPQTPHHNKHQNGTTDKNSSRQIKYGTVRYIGPLHCDPKPLWIGIELDLTLGRNDGSVKGTRYFQCAPKRGIFAQPDRVFKIDPDSDFAISPDACPNLNRSSLSHSRTSLTSPSTTHMLKKSQHLVPSGMRTPVITNSPRTSLIHQQSHRLNSLGGTLSLAGSRESLNSNLSFISNATSRIPQLKKSRINQNTHEKPSSLLHKNTTLNSQQSLVANTNQPTSKPSSTLNFDANKLKVLEKELMELTHELARIRSLEESHRLEISRYSTLLNEKSEECTTLNCQMEEYQTEMNEQLRQFRIQIEEFEKQNEDLEQKLTDEKNKVEDLNYQLTEMSIVKEDSLSDEKAPEQINHLETPEFKQMTERIKSLESDLTNANEKNQKLVKQNQELKNQMAESVKLFAQMKHENEKALIVNQHDKTHITEMAQEIDKFKADLSQKENEINEFKNLYDQNKSELVKILEENKRQNIQIAKLNTELAQVKQESSKKIDNMTLERKVYSCELDKVQNEHTQLKLELEKTRQEITNLSKNYGDMEQSRIKLASQLTQLQSIQDSQLMVIDALQTEKESALSEIKLLKAKLESAPLNNGHIDHNGGDLHTSKDTDEDHAANIHEQCLIKQKFLNSVLVGMNQQNEKLQTQIKELKKQFSNGCYGTNSKYSEENSDTDEEGITKEQNGYHGDQANGNSFTVQTTPSLSSSGDFSIAQPSKTSSSLTTQFSTASNSPNDSKHIIMNAGELQGSKKYRKRLSNPADLLFNRIQRMAKQRVLETRMYCDNCQVFDAHETENCDVPPKDYANDTSNDNIIISKDYKISNGKNINGVGGGGQHQNTKESFTTRISLKNGENFTTKSPNNPLGENQSQSPTTVQTIKNVVAPENNTFTAQFRKLKSSVFI